MPAAAVTKYLQPRFATRLKVARRQTAKSLGKIYKVICESGDFRFQKEGIVCAGLNIWQGLLNMWAVMWWMFCHLGAVCLEIQYEINHTNLLLDNTASASFSPKVQNFRFNPTKNVTSSCMWYPLQIEMIFLAQKSFPGIKIPKLHIEIPGWLYQISNLKNSISFAPSPLPTSPSGWGEWRGNLAARKNFHTFSQCWHTQTFFQPETSRTLNSKH